MTLTHSLQHIGSMTYSTHGYSQSGGRAVHERSHSDTPTPLPSVDLSVESSSVTSLSNLPLRKNITSGKIFKFSNTFIPSQLIQCILHQYTVLTRFSNIFCMENSQSFVNVCKYPIVAGGSPL